MEKNVLLLYFNSKNQNYLNMKILISTICVMLLSFSLFAQGKYTNKKGKNWKVEEGDDFTYITSEYGKIKTTLDNYTIVAPQKGDKFGKPYIKTEDGQTLKIGDGGFTTNFAANAAQPTAQSGPEVISSVTHSDGGHTITISTTTSTTAPNGKITSTTKSSTINTRTGETEREVTVSNGQTTPDAGGVTIVVKDE